MLEQIVTYFSDITWFEIAAQIIGLFGTATFFISYQQRDKHRIIFFQIIAISLFVVHFFMLGAYTGALLNVFGVVRAVVYYNSDKKWAQSRLWFYGLLVAYTVVGILTWENYISLLPIAAMILSTFAFEEKDVLRFRLLSFPCSPMWLVYNIKHMSVSGSITECFTMASMIIAFFRYYILKKDN